MYEYAECGLGGILLKNGYEEYETSYGKGVGIHDVDGLHRAIGLYIAESKPEISGDEARFLRKEIGLSQVELANLLGVSDSTVRGWEKERREIAKPVERLLRVLYCEHANEGGVIRGLIDRISKMNRDGYHGTLEMEETEEGWAQAA